MGFEPEGQKVDCKLVSFFPGCKPPGVKDQSSPRPFPDPHPAWSGPHGQGDKGVICSPQDASSGLQAAEVSGFQRLQVEPSDV